MEELKIRTALCFDDVLLLPKKSTIKSRSEVDLSSNLGKVDFRLPIVSSPMDTVTGPAMVLKMLSHGGLGILHRYNTIADQCRMVKDIRENLEQSANVNIVKISAAIGTSGDYLSRARHLFDAGARIFCLDVAHGHHLLVHRALQEIRNAFGESVHLIVGNVATLEAFNDLSDWGADSIRVGIGGGSICSTRIQTGHGMPTLQSVLDCAQSDRDAGLIADGGIKSAGDIVKALAAGADMVMLGSMLAGTLESPGEIHIAADGEKFKVYRGMASIEAQVAWRGQARSLEGVSTTIPFKGPVENILGGISQNIRSGFSYTGARNIKQMQTMSTFIKQSASGLYESKTHILAK